MVNNFIQDNVKSYFLKSSAPSKRLFFKLNVTGRKIAHQHYANANSIVHTKINK